MISRRMITTTAVLAAVVVTATGVRVVLGQVAGVPVPGAPAPIHKLYDGGISFGPSDGPPTINAFDNGGSPDLEGLVTQLNQANSAVPRVNAGVYCQNPQNGPSCWLPGSLVSVDGDTIPNYVLFSNLQTVTGSAQPSLTDMSAIRAAIALAVLHRVEYDEGVKAGLTPSDAEVRDMAERQLAAYNANPTAAQSAKVVPAGTTPEDYFLSSSMLASYKRLMTIGEERAAILAAYSHPKYDNTPAFAAWFTAVLPHHQVSITGVSAFALAEALPESL